MTLYFSDYYFKCGFEEGFCSLAQDQTDDFDWTRTGGETATYGTGPYYAFEGDIYAYIQAKGRKEGSMAM